MMAVFTGPPVVWNKPCIIWHTKKNVLHNAAFVTIDVDTPMKEGRKKEDDMIRNNTSCKQIRVKMCFFHLELHTDHNKEQAKCRSQQPDAYHQNRRESISQLSSDEGSTGICEHETGIHRS